MEENSDECYRSINHAERLVRKMEAYHAKRDLCDVVLIAGPRQIHAHRLVLSSASDYFSAMFTSDVREATQEEIRMKDVDPDALAALVQYMYTGESFKEMSKKPFGNLSGFFFLCWFVPLGTSLLFGRRKDESSF